MSDVIGYVREPARKGETVEATLAAAMVAEVECNLRPHTLGDAVAGVVDAMRREAATRGVIEMAESLRAVAVVSAVNLDCAPLSPYARRSRKRLRRQQEAFAAWWRGRCVRAAGIHAQASALYAGVARSGWSDESAATRGGTG